MKSLNYLLSVNVELFFVFHFNVIHVAYVVFRDFENKALI